MLQSQFIRYSLFSRIGFRGRRLYIRSVAESQRILHRCLNSSVMLVDMWKHLYLSITGSDVCLGSNRLRSAKSSLSHLEK